MAAEKSLKYFMRDLEPEVVTVPGPDSIKDENGEVVQFEIKVLPQSRIDEIYAKYRTRSFATDSKKNPLIANGEVVWKTEKDNARALRHIIVEALQYPDLNDSKLMEYYKCVDVTKMPLMVFPRSDEYQYVTKVVTQALGLSAKVDDNEELEEAKNS